MLASRLTATAPPTPRVQADPEVAAEGTGAVVGVGGDGDVAGRRSTIESAVIKASTTSEITLPTPEPAIPTSPPTAKPSERLWIVAAEVAANAMSPPGWFAVKPDRRPSGSTRRRRPGPCSRCRYSRRPRPR